MGILTSRSARTLALAGVGAALLLFALGSSPVTTAPNPGTQELVSQPASWQPFIAKLRITYPGSPTVVVGTVYRRADGSERNDTGPKGGPIGMVSIRNHAVRAFFSWTAERGWRRNPLGQFDLTRPPGRIRTASIAEAERAATTIEGLLVWRDTTQDGDEAYVAPELNLYPLVLNSRDGRRVELHDIRRVDPPDHLFLPPDGAVVKESSIPIDGLLKLRR